MWISLKMLCSSVLVTFADAKLLDLSPSDSSMIYVLMECCIHIHYNIRYYHQRMCEGVW